MWTTLTYWRENRTKVPVFQLPSILPWIPTLIPMALTYPQHHHVTLFHLHSSRRAVLFLLLPNQELNPKTPLPFPQNFPAQC